MSHHNQPPKPLYAQKHQGRSQAIEIAIEGDKSISHRAIMLGMLAKGRSYVTGLLEGEDVLATIKACQQLGADIKRLSKGEYEIYGRGIGLLDRPETPLDFGNSGTGVRLMMGIIAGNPISVTLTGDASLCSRPMGRVAEPLSQMGATFTYQQEEGKLPCVLKGALHPLPTSFEQQKASAQIKSAILLAALTSPGTIAYHEKTPTRDHTENMLKGFGAHIDVQDDGEGGNIITLQGEKPLIAQNIQVPSDPSSAAFFIAAALLVEGSDITLRNILMNDTRIGVITSWQEMGGDIEIFNKRLSGGEALADIRVRHSQLKGVTVPASRAPSMIDEYPILAITAAFAEGITHMQGLDELRVKESDRLQAVYDGLILNGVQAEIKGDDLIITGASKITGGGMVTTHLDHRIAMSFLILGLKSENAVYIDDARMIDTSFPSFIEKMKAFGAVIKEP